ncbi:hypothetical protein KDA_55330 [Dictyobacter alpinus]|uniref:3-keto-disaccharide hydrolase domain-containing protein n=2 Tax=Dictyobacter alpinus TaxID=2014873 RepID=A0A402BFD0_9CHLR|nr:hypothetical protein KDA_55330 [Dictyobacter alpinus]
MYLPHDPGNPYQVAGQLLINDALTSDASAIVQHSNTEGTCLYKDGAFHNRVIRKTYIKPCMLDGIILHNFVYEVQMQFLQGNCGGILFRSNFPLMYYFLVCTNGQYRLVRYDRDNVANRKILLVQTTSALHTGLKAINTLAVVAQDSHFELFINTLKIAQAQDTAYAEGQIGTLAHTCSIARTDYDCVDTTEVRFTNLHVWKLP